MTYGDRLVTEPVRGSLSRWVPAPVPHTAPDETLYLDGAIPADADQLVCDRCSSPERVQIHDGCSICGPTPLCPRCLETHRIEAGL